MNTKGNMRKHLAFCVVATMLTLIPTSAIERNNGAAQSIRETHMIYTDGNKLYSDCQAVEKSQGDLIDDTFAAGECFGYITAIAESIPMDNFFNPAPSVKQRQYVDVVYNYLRDHPEKRNEDAFFLTRNALVSAFKKTQQ